MNICSPGGRCSFIVFFVGKERVGVRVNLVVADVFFTHAFKDVLLRCFLLLLLVPFMSDEIRLFLLWVALRSQ